jgi:hypothetical protein
MNAQVSDTTGDAKKSRQPVNKKYLLKKSTAKLA